MEYDSAGTVLCQYIIPYGDQYGNLCLFAMMCGYAFAKGKFMFKNFWFIFMLAVMMIPFESRMIPLYIQYKNWGMLDTYKPLIFGSFAYVYGVFFPDRILRRYRIL